MPISPSSSLIQYIPPFWINSSISFVNFLLSSKFCELKLELVIPEKFYNKMSSSDIVLIEEEIDVRIENIYNEYVKKSLKNKSNEELSIHLGKKLAKISNRLGGVHYDQVDNLIKNAFEKNDKQTHYDWIEKLLLNYYDKMYDYQIEQKKDRCLQSGDWSEIFEFLSNYN